MTAVPAPRGRRRDPDQGSALVMVLVLVLVSGLMILPMMSYMISVARANSVLSDKTKRMEAVRAGLRVALAEPAKLYETCGEAGETVARPLAGPNIGGIGVATSCYFIDFAAAESEETLRYGLTVTQVGEVIPEELTGTRHVSADPNDPTSWLNDTELESVTDTVWLPNLAVHALSPRSAIPYQMPAGFPACRVYFPGTYVDPLVLDGPTFFTSGIYYFEAEVLVTDGADVVVGQGVPGCATDQEAAFYAVNPPATHNISGQGATWVFGHQGRLVVRNGSGAPASLRFSQRYVAPEDTGGAPSQGVSIITVNGENVGTDYVDLDLPGVIRVPRSMTGSVDPVPASQQAYRASVFTPKPAPPAAPFDVTAEPRNAHVRVRWSEPAANGSPITGYTVTLRRVSSPATTHTCTTPANQLECTVGGLTNSQFYSVEVVAQNAVGASPIGAPAADVRPTSGSGSVTVPGVPTAVSAQGFDGAVRVSWTPPANDGNAPITAYTVTGTPGGTCTAGYGETSCVVTGIAPVSPGSYTFRVTATNMIGTSSQSSASAGVQPTGPALPVDEDDDDEVPVNVPPAVVDLDLVGTSQVTVEISGYIATPQGRFRLFNPTSQPVEVKGGILAAAYEVADGRASDPPQNNEVPVGFIETIVQRKFRIVSETTSGLPRMVSNAIVQVNQNGAYAINSWEIR